MSQFFTGSTASGPISPTIPTQFNTQNGNATTINNVITINGFDSTEDNSNGIITKGGVAGTGTINEIDVVITNRLQASGSTVGAVTTPIATMALSATPGNYAFEFYASGFEATGPSGTAYNILACIRTTGVVATLVGTSDETFVEDAALGASDLQVTVSANSVIVNAIGIAGLTIDWNVVGIYTFIG